MDPVGDIDKTHSQTSVKKEDGQTAAQEPKYEVEVCKVKTENSEDVDMEGDLETSKVYRFTKDEDFIPLNTGIDVMGNYGLSNVDCHYICEKKYSQTCFFFQWGVNILLWIFIDRELLILKISLC